MRQRAGVTAEGQATEIASWFASNGGAPFIRRRGLALRPNFEGPMLAVEAR